jgi:phospholipase C
MARCVPQRAFRGLSPPTLPKSDLVAVEDHPKTHTKISENALTLQHGQRYNLRTIRTTANTSNARINSVRVFRPPWGPGTTLRLANPLMFARLCEPPRSNSRVDLTATSGARVQSRSMEQNMTTDLNLIEHIFVVMMENRSFDHMLGYLDLPPSRLLKKAN